MTEAETRKLYTLTEVAKRTGISMPTLQRYKRLYQARLPAQGKGRRQRYPEGALAVFQAIKKENMARRGRPRKRVVKRRRAAARKAAPVRRAKAAKRAATVRSRAPRKAPARAGGLLSLAEIGRRTSISYPTLLRYLKLHLNRIPHVGKGRRRRFPETAVEVFRALRLASGRVRRGAAGAARGARRAMGADLGLARRIRELEAAQAAITSQLKELIQTLKKPLEVTIRPR